MFSLSLFIINTHSTNKLIDFPIVHSLSILPYKLSFLPIAYDITYYFIIEYCIHRWYIFVLMLLNSNFPTNIFLWEKKGSNAQKKRDFNARNAQSLWEMWAHTMETALNKHLKRISKFLLWIVRGMRSAHV